MDDSGLRAWYEFEGEWLTKSGPDRLHEIMLDVGKILELHDQCVALWHESSSPSHNYEGIYRWVADEHVCNFALWHQEDLARVPDTPDRAIVQAKGEIDQKNQQRNDSIEAIDEHLWNLLRERGLPDEQASLHSETPGMMIDRLSILSLKVYHTVEEIQRPDAPPGHAERNRDRYRILDQQRKDLADCLQALWRDVLAGRRTFKIYRQLKMYNDPTLNPALYRRAAARDPDR